MDKTVQMPHDFLSPVQQENAFKLYLRDDGENPVKENRFMGPNTGKNGKIKGKSRRQTAFESVELAK